MGKIYFYLILCLFISSAFAEQDHSYLVLKILGVNDFHGQITEGRRVNDLPVGGAAMLAAYLKNEEQGMDSRVLIAFSGDQVGASPPASALLGDKPTISFFNQLANASCQGSDKLNPTCNLVATIGNHEFDRGQAAMLKLIQAANFPYISSNIVSAKTGKLLFQPYVLKKIQGVTIGVIGAILKDAPSVIMTSNIKGIKFLDEVESINHYLPLMKAKGADIIIVIIHQGGQQVAYKGPTQLNTKVEGPIVDIVNRLDSEVDVVLSGHTHQFTNAFLPNHNGKKILVTQANSYSTDFAVVTLWIDRNTHTITKKSAEIITTLVDNSKHLTPDPGVQKLVSKAELKTKPLTHRFVGTLKNPLFKKGNEAGESDLGNLIADATRASMKAEMALINSGGIRGDLFSGPITWGAVYAVQPFENNLQKVQLTGEQLYEVLNQQWLNQPKPRILQISGFRYSWDATKNPGQRIVAICFQQKPIEKNRLYTIATNTFLAGGGDNFITMRKAKMLDMGPLDIDALIAYIKHLPQPFTAKIEGRIQLIQPRAHFSCTGKGSI